MQANPSIFDRFGHRVLAAIMVLLLVLAGVAGESSLVSTLRGQSAGDEGGQSRSAGYYEALIASGPNSGARGTSGPDEPPAGWLPFTAAQAGIVEDSQTYLRWKLRPNLDTRWNGFRFHTNQLGYRSPEIVVEKSDVVYRIVVFGSSNTMGHGVNDDDLFTRHLERWLNDRIGPAYRAEVVNLAVAGDSPTRRLLRMQTEAERLHPDWLICDASVLDTWLEDVHIHAVLERRLPIPFTFVQEAIDRSGVQPADNFDVFRARFQGESERMLDAVYAGWSREASRLDTPLTVLILPRADSKARSPRVFDLIRALARKHRLETIDLSAIFDSLELEEYRSSGWDKHPNARGHLLIFQAIRDALMYRGELPGMSLSIPPTLQADR